MKTQASNMILSFIENKMESDSFQEWLFLSTTQQNIDNEELYEELIILNYSSAHSRKNVEKILLQLDLMKLLHLNKIKYLLNNFINEMGNPFEQIEILNTWADKGYTFLGSIDVIGNFREQGKSIVYHINRKMNPKKQHQILKEKYDTLKNEFKQVLNKIESGKIELTGKTREVKGFGEIYEFNINE